MHILARSVTTRARAWVALVIAIAGIGVVFALPHEEQVATDASAGLPSSVQSQQVDELKAKLPSADARSALVVWSRADGAALTEADKATVSEREARVGALALGGRAVPVQYSQDGTVGLSVVPLPTIEDTEKRVQLVDDLRAAVADLPGGLRAQVTGGEGFYADLDKVFAGANTTLLLATVIVVAVLLFATYRSPLLPLVPLLVVGATEQAVARIIEVVLPAFDLRADGQVAGITSVLVFGAATDYALLLIARYRDELRLTPDRFAAMRVALRRCAEAILASGGTVVLATLTLLFSLLEGNRALGLACAIGVLAAMAAGLFVLPAALVLLPRGVFWPLVPRVGSTGTTGRLWGRVGAWTAARPATAIVASLALLGGLAAAGLTLRAGLSETERFRVEPEAVAGAKTLARAFPAGTTQPVTVLTSDAAAPAVLSAAKGVEGVVTARVEESAEGITAVQVVLQPEPGTDASDAAVRALRTAVGAVPDSAPPGLTQDAPTGAIVGGEVAATLDQNDANSRDLKLILPIILALVAIVLVALLRSLLAPALLVLTVVASFFASLGASWLVFDHLMGLPALDTGVLLLAFLFLVALGVDYNIFLVTRAREEAEQTGTREGMLIALKATGGVITSAGVLLAAVFAVLGVLPLLALTQIGIIVGIGVLLDTLLVRTVLVPALAFQLGERFWWPHRLKVSKGEAEPAPVAV
ncbi:MAG: MMPL family transporter [Kineosporiaceae bacterium]